MSDLPLLFLGLCEKAGYLVVGEELCLAAARSGKASLILSACDAAPNSVRRAENVTGFGTARITLPYTKEKLGSILGHGTPGILVITDYGMAATFTAKLALEDSENYGDISSDMRSEYEKRRKRVIEQKKHDKNRKTNRKKSK